MIPNLIIAGAVKGGTTSLYTYLSWHPDICASSIKETDFFMPVIHGRNIPSVKKYRDYFNHYQGQKYIMEASPRYMIGGKDIAMSIIRHVGTVKIIFLLRDPVERLFSFYRHMKRAMKIPAEWRFAQYVEHSADIYGQSLDVEKDKFENVFISALSEGQYVDLLDQWCSVFGDSVNVCFFEHLRDDTPGFMKDICRWLDIDSKVYESRTFYRENKSYMYKVKIIHMLAQYVNAKSETILRKRHWIKKILRELYYHVNEKKDADKEEIPEEVRTFLEEFYCNTNERLVEYLKLLNHTNMPPWVASQCRK